MKRNFVFLCLLLFCVMALALVLWRHRTRVTLPVPRGHTQPYSFEDCVAAGYPVMESHPRRCTAGKFTFVETVNQEKLAPVLTDQPVVLDGVQPHQLITSPLQVAGEAMGNWFFEAKIGLRLLDANGVEVAHGHATARGDWTVQGMVPFSGSIAFAPPHTSEGFLEIVKDNPSGKQELDTSVSVPIRFRK